MHCSLVKYFCLQRCPENLYPTLRPVYLVPHNLIFGSHQFEENDDLDNYNNFDNSDDFDDFDKSDRNEKQQRMQQSQEP